jgi:hypothetical protein
MGDIAHAFGWAPDVLWELTVDELLMWHEQAKRFRER